MESSSLGGGIVGTDFTGSSEFADALRDAIKGSYDGFKARFSEVNHTWSEDDLQVDGCFLYPSFTRGGKPTIADLAQYIYWKIIPFCIPASEREEFDSKYRETNDDRYKMEIVDKARNLFVRARKSQKSSGEPGELMLFIFLEAILKAPQIACKMYLKTNTNVPVHGSDSIHAMTGKSGANLNLVWGESKTYKKLNSALDEACDSIAGFLKPGHDGERPPRERDIQIIKDHLNITDPVLRASVLDFFDPYSEKFNEKEEMFAVLVAYEEPCYAQLNGVNPDRVEEKFREMYLDCIKSACNYLASKLRELRLDHLKVHLFLLPVPDIKEFRREFFDRLGVPRPEYEQSNLEDQEQSNKAPLTSIGEGPQVSRKAEVSGGDSS